MDAAKAFEEVAKMAPKEPDRAYIPIVAAALRSKASYLKISYDQGGTIFDYDGDVLFDSENLFQIALKANNTRPEKHLANGLWCLNQSEPTWVSYESWDGTSGGRVKVEAGKVKFEKILKAPWKETTVFNRVRMQSKKGWKPFGGLFGGSGKIDTVPPEVKTIIDLCRFAPIPIEINQQVISKPVDLGRSLVCLVFDPPTERRDVQRLSLGEQDTLDQVRVTAGEAYSAIIAVGGQNPQLATLNLVVDGMLIKQDDPQLAAMGLRCVITCSDLQLDTEGRVVKDEAYQAVLADLTRKALAIGEVLADQMGDMNALDRVEAADYVKYYADQHEALGEFDDAERLFLRLLEAQEEALGDDDPELAETLLKIAALREQQGHYKEARESYHRVLELFEDIRPDQAQLASCHAGLASLAFAEEQYEAAEQDAQIALDLRKSHLDPNDIQLGISYELLARIYRARYQYPHRKFLEVDTLYLQAIRVFEKSLGASHLDVANLVFDVAEHRRGQRRYREAEPQYKRALNIRKEQLGEYDPLVAETLDSLGTLYEEQGRSAQAGDAYEQALKIWEKIHGPNHDEVVGRINNLVVLYRLYGKFSQAEPLYERILGSHTEDQQPDSLEAAQDYSNLALLHAAQKKYDLAEQGLRKALAFLDQVGNAAEERAWTLDQLSEVLVQQNRYEEAEKLLQQGFELWGKALGEDHPDLCVNLEQQGRVFARQGKSSQAEEVFRRSLDLKEKLQGPTHPDTINVLGSLAEALRAAGKEEESLAMHRDLLVRRERAVREAEEVQEADQQEMAAPAATTGRYSKARAEAEALSQQAIAPAKVYKRYQEAEHLYLKALFAREQALGPSHPDIAHSLDDLAGLYRRHRKFEAAQELCQRTLELRRQTLGRQHPDVALNLVALIDILCTQQRWSAAEPLTREWLSLVEATVGEHHPEAANVLETQARIYGAAGALEKQEECNRRALEVRRQALGTEHPDFATSLADLLCLQKKYEEASRLYSFVVSSLEESLGPESAELIPVYEKYAGVLRKLNRESLAVELETQAMVMRVQHGLDFGDN